MYGQTPVPAQVSTYAGKSLLISVMVLYQEKAASHMLVSYRFDEEG